jgi:hypothetical protein
MKTDRTMRANSSRTPIDRRRPIEMDPPHLHPATTSKRSHTIENTRSARMQHASETIDVIVAMPSNSRGWV